ncbi:unnamed protein product [marine sediment metagenome]|uniref:Uncharacterized protein n=1 Tax=marine sediment metagenome TaxID=412755 RepID=X1T5D4_9ZZZZ
MLLLEAYCMLKFTEVGNSKMALTKGQKTGLGILGTLAAIFGIRQLAKAEGF